MQVLEAPPALRWATAGGCLDSINAAEPALGVSKHGTGFAPGVSCSRVRILAKEASAALLGNAQQKQWYRHYLGIAVEELRD